MDQRQGVSTLRRAKCYGGIEHHARKKAKHPSPTSCLSLMPVSKGLRNPVFYVGYARRSHALVSMARGCEQTGTQVPPGREGTQLPDRWVSSDQTSPRGITRFFSYRSKCFRYVLQSGASSRRRQSSRSHLMEAIHMPVNRSRDRKLD